MEKIIELIEKYLLFNINEEKFKSNLKKLYRKKEFTYEELCSIVDYINYRPKKIRSKSRLIEIFIIYFIEEHIVEYVDDQVVEMTFDKVCNILEDLNVKLSRSLIIQLINKNIINKNNLEEASKKDEIINAYYIILKEDIKIDYNYLMKDLADVTIYNYDPKKILNEKNELAILKDYKKVDAELKVALKKLNNPNLANSTIEEINTLLAKREQISTCLLKYNYGLVHDILNTSKNYKIYSCDYDFFFNEGLLGLTDAIQKYNLFSGIKLSTYAYPYIKMYIVRAVSGERLVKLPTDVLESPKAMSRLSDEDLQSFLNAKNSFISLDAKVGDSEDSDELYNLNIFSEPLADNYKGYFKDIAEEAIENYNREKILKLLKDNLSESRYNIIYDYFYNDLKKSEIAEKNNYSDENADQKINRALNQIKKIPGIQDIAQYGYGFKIPEKIEPVSEGEKDMVTKIEEKNTKEIYGESRIDNFDVRANVKENLLRKFCGCFKVEYKKSPKDTNDSVAFEYIDRYLTENNKSTFERDIYSKYGNNISTFSGYPFIKESDIETELRKKDKVLPTNASPLYTYMEIDDIFYLKIADKIREEHKNNEKDTLNKAKSYTNDNIYYHVRFLANYYLNKYYYEPRNIKRNLSEDVASDTVIKDLLELVLVSYDGNIPMTSHLKEVIKYTIEQAVMVYNKIGDDLEYTIEEEIAMLLNNEYELIWGKLKSLS